jgi:streptogramin lyase
VWLSEWAANAIVRFDPATEKFESFPSNRPNFNERQMLGRKGETWIAESGTERIPVIAVIYLYDRQLVRHWEMRAAITRGLP